MKRIQKLTPINPNEGHGRPGSLEFHKAHILACETPAELRAYVESVIGKKQKIPFYVLQVIAMENIEEFYRDCEKGK